METITSELVASVSLSVELLCFFAVVFLCCVFLVVIYWLVRTNKNSNDRVERKVDYVLVDRLNCHYADWVYCKYGLEDRRSDEFFQRMGRELASWFEKLNIPCYITF